MITVATFNARHGRPSRGLANNRLLETSVAALRADLVGLQEVERHVIRSRFRNQPAAIARAARMRSVYAPARRFAVTGDDEEIGHDVPCISAARENNAAQFHASKQSRSPIR